MQLDPTALGILRDAVPNGKPSSEIRQIAVPQTVSAADLFVGNITTLRSLLEDLAWDGLTMLIARPKAGKSWLTLQLAIHVAGGREVEGVRSNGYGPVLYIALEEPKARTMLRIRKLAAAGDWAMNLEFWYELLPLMGGGAEQIEQYMRANRPRLVVIDTLTAALKLDGGKGKSDVFRSQYAEVTRIRKIAEDFECAIILVHHERKGASDGGIQAVAGTGGVAAAIDTLWHLKRKPEGEGTLDVVGREADERTFALKFGQEPFGWQFLGDSDSQLQSGERKELIQLLNEEGGLTPAQIAPELGKSRPAVRMLLKRMRADGQVRKEGTKYFPSLSKCYSVTERERE